MTPMEAAAKIAKLKAVAENPGTFAEGENARRLIAKIRGAYGIHGLDKIEPTMFGDVAYCLCGWESGCKTTRNNALKAFYVHEREGQK